MSKTSSWTMRAGRGGEQVHGWVYRQTAGGQTSLTWMPGASRTIALHGAQQGGDRVVPRLHPGERRKGGARLIDQLYDWPLHDSPSTKQVSMDLIGSRGPWP